MQAIPRRNNMEEKQYVVTVRLSDGKREDVERWAANESDARQQAGWGYLRDGVVESVKEFDENPYQRKYTATVDQSLDFGDPEAAIQHVEQAGRGRVVLFAGSPNLRGCLPFIRFRSCAMWTYQDGKWWVHAIDNGTGERVAEQRPH
jgi:hypothetical protein